MDGAEFVRRARRHGRKAGVVVLFDPSRGKGSHGMLYLGRRRTAVKQGELKTGTFRAMLKQLGIREEDF
ncbi:MAG: type II toxin-antitoxin system HicA family toxin [Gemmatimonadetes bacterium]|nr:type II toxin-antitoxin system HicA family toxin [Gemmatimonadota bacterium]MYK64964.1 type II toxin-antitoxin system HicA family toxin [Gemmatimonadota bacterium]